MSEKLNKEEELLKNKLEEASFEYNAADWVALKSQMGSKTALSGLAKVGLVAATATALLVGTYFLNKEQPNKEAVQLEETIPSQTNKVPKQKSTILEKSDNAIASKKIEDFNKRELDGTDEKSQLENLSKKAEITPSEPIVQKQELKIIDEPQKKEDAAVEQKKAVNFYLNGIKASPTICYGGLLAMQLDYNGSLPDSYQIGWVFDRDTMFGKLEGIEIVNKKHEDFQLKVIVKDGSRIVAEKQRWVRLNDSKSIDFTYEDQSDLFNDYSAQLKVTEPTFKKYSWSIQDRDEILTGNELMVDFTSKGIYDVTLEAVDDSGCISTVVKPVAIMEDFDPLVPNAFTPNGDALNDLFLAEGLKDVDEEFKLQVFDLQGNEVFSTTESNKAWNGQLNNEGVLLPNNYYVWKVNITNKKSKQRTFMGRVQIMD